MLQTLNVTSASRYVVFITGLFLFLSCQKDLSMDNGAVIVTPPDLVTTVRSSASGFVIDENNQPVQNATVTMGPGATSTDKYGYFQFKNIQVVQNGALISVKKPGYFKGVKTYIAKEGKAVFFRIKLSPKTIEGNFNSAAGGTVTTASGVSITLPANAVVNAATSAAYTGTVNVAAKYFDPKDAEINKLLPGGSIGINAEGAMKLLGNYGALAVELTGASGELLQISAGKKASLVLPINAALLASAPASIPLWYMDEATGLWKQEGNGTRSGNTYTGEVSHFSFWDWAAQSSYVYFDCTIKDAFGNGIPNALVFLDVAPTIPHYGYGYTDETGYVGGLIPDNTQFAFKVFPGNFFMCTYPVYTQSLVSTNVPISLGDIPIDVSHTAILSGNITNCANAPVTNGSVLEYMGYTYYKHTVSSSGTFSFPILICNSPSQILLTAQDLTANQYGPSLSYSITSGNNNIGTLSACGNTVDEFMHFTVNNVSYNYTAPSCYFYTLAWPNMVQMMANRSLPTYQTAQADFTRQNIAPNSIQDLISFRAGEINDSLITINPIPVYITEYGNTGEYISGTFSGTMKSYYTPANTFSVSCAFRMKRYF